METMGHSTWIMPNERVTCSLEKIDGSKEVNKLFSSFIREPDYDSPSMPPARRVKKRIADIDYIEVWIPALTEPSQRPTSPIPDIAYGSPGMEETHPHLLGSFSGYSASPPGKRPASYSSSPRQIPGGVKFSDNSFDLNLSPSNRTDRSTSLHTRERVKDAEGEAFIGKVEMKADLNIGGLLGKLYSVLEGLAGSQSPTAETDAATIKTEEPNSRKKLEVVVGEVDLRLVERLFGNCCSKVGSRSREVVRILMTMEQSFLISISRIPEPQCCKLFRNRQAQWQVI